MAYVGHAGPNPMTNGGDGYVTVFEIGQGNCNMLVGANGNVVAFFDFGYSTKGPRRPPKDLVPCMCNDPPVILSHWDWDHIWMFNHAPEIACHRWLAPFQTFSTYGKKLRSAVKSMGGEMHIWPTSDSLHSFMPFPWGYVERCKERAGKTNGSGIAMFVCVRDDPAAVATVTRTPVAPASQPYAEPVRPFARRARDAWVRAGGAGAAAVQPLAVLVACSQTGQRQQNMPIRECVAAARAAVSLIARNGPNANTPAALAGALVAQDVLPTLAAQNMAYRASAAQELARAALAMRGRKGYRARLEEGARCFTYDNDIKGASDAKDKGARFVAAMGGRAASPAPVRAPLDPVALGLAPVRKGERYVFLNGDAEYKWVPSMRRHRPPRVIAMTAMHHGAIYEDSGTLDSTFIPFAPGSRAAKAVCRARPRVVRGPCSVVTLAVEAGICAGAYPRKKNTRRARTAAARAATAAAAAVLAVEHVNGGTIGTASERTKYAVAAAAAAVAAVFVNDVAAIGVAAALGAASTGSSAKTNGHPLTGSVDVALWAVAERRAGNLVTKVEAQKRCRGGLDGCTTRDLSSIADQAILAATAAAAGTAAMLDVWTQASRYPNIADKFYRSVPYKKRADLGTPINANTRNESDSVPVGHLAGAAAAAAMAPGTSAKSAARGALTQQGVAAGGLAAALGAVEPLVRAAAQARHPYVWPPTTLAETAQAAAALAAEAAVARTLDVPLETLAIVIATVSSRRLTRYARAAASMKPSSGRIAYSYGVSGTDRSHEFEVIDGADIGHAHPVAVAKYEGHGWTERRNMSRHARHAGPAGDMNPDHPTGAVKLHWRSATDSPPPKGHAHRACPLCGKTFRCSS